MAQATETNPTAEDVAEAGRALEQLALRRGDLVRSMTLVGSDGSAEEHAHVTLEVSEEVSRLLLRLLAHMADGHGVVLVRRDRELTTQEAAELLNVSRPHLVKLVDEGKLPARRVGTHRRLRLDHVLAYQREQLERSKELLGELAAEAQDMGLGY